MAGIPTERSRDVRAALRIVISDPGHGAATLSSPQAMSNLLKDLLPDAPREKNLLVAAAEANLAAMMLDHVTQGMDAGSAIKLAAASFGDSTHFTRAACTWVATELAVALGLADGQAVSVSELPAGDITTRNDSPAHTARGADAGEAGASAQGIRPVPGAGPAPTRVAAERPPDDRTYPEPDSAGDRGAGADPRRAGRPVSVSAVLVLAGAAALLTACVLPVFSDSGHGVRLWSFPFWMSSGPIVTALLAALGGARLLVPGASRLARVAAGTVAAIGGVEMLILFVALDTKFVAGYGDPLGAGLVIGLLSALLLGAGSGIELRRQFAAERAPAAVSGTAGR